MCVKDIACNISVVFLRHSVDTVHVDHISLGLTAISISSSRMALLLVHNRGDL